MRTDLATVATSDFCMTRGRNDQWRFDVLVNPPFAFFGLQKTSNAARV
jgi:hypothetical protein